MKKYEEMLIPIFESLKQSTIITMKDFDAVQKLFGDIILKLNMQREELIESRDNWKEKYMRLKNAK